MLNNAYVVTYGPAMDRRSFPFTREGLRDAVAFMESEGGAARLSNPNREDLDFDGLDADERELVDEFRNAMTAGDVFVVRVERMRAEPGAGRWGWGWFLVDAGMTDADKIRGLGSLAEAVADAKDHFPQALVVV